MLVRLLTVRNCYPEVVQVSEIAKNRIGKW
jgi:hypothetical protein